MSKTLILWKPGNITLLCFSLKNGVTFSFAWGVVFENDNFDFFYFELLLANLSIESFLLRLNFDDLSPSSKLTITHILKVVPMP